MSKILLAYSLDDNNLANEVAEGLKEKGHEIVHDYTLFETGQNWRDNFSHEIRDAHAVVAIVSESSLHDLIIRRQIATARSYATESGRLLIVPILVGAVTLPSELEDYLGIRASGESAESIVNLIDGAISSFVGRYIAKQERAAEFAERIEKNSSDYVDEAISMQRISERTNRDSASRWYALGFISLVAGVLFALASLFMPNLFRVSTAAEFAAFSLRNLIVIGLLSAAARYSFILGKSYVSESLKSADRIHAISFGRFYLRAYGDRATWEEIKEVFANWNIDKPSNFATTDASQFDPKLVELLAGAVDSAVARITRTKPNADA